MFTTHWKLIVGAPKDGTEILVWIPLERRRLVVKWVVQENPSGVSNFEGWLESRYKLNIQPPSHYADLPKPPKLTKCHKCGEDYYMVRHSGRRRYCSDRCRMRVYRERLKESANA